MWALGLFVKYRKQVFKLYIALNYLAFLLSAFLLSETVDFTVEAGLILNEQYLIWLLISVVVTIVLCLFKNNVKAYVKRNFSV